MSATTWALDSVGSAWEIGPGPNEKIEMVSPRYTIQTHSITTSSGHVSTAQPINLQRPLNQGTKKIRSGLSFSPPSLVKTNQSLRLSEASSTCLSPSSSLRFECQFWLCRLRLHAGSLLSCPYSLLGGVVQPWRLRNCASPTQRVSEGRYRDGVV